MPHGTQPNQADAALRESDERFRQAFEFAGIGMAIVGLDGRWVRVNGAICEIVGYSEAELLQRTFQDITHPDDLETDLAHVRELLDGKRRAYQMEKRYFHRDGHVIWIRLTASLMRDGAEQPLYFISQIEDITAHKQLEKNYVVARDQALKASRLKSEFLANVSHEIRTPMNAVVGMTDLLLDTSLGAEQLDLLQTIRSSAASLLLIINDILDFSKIESGLLPLDSAEFAPHQVVKDVVSFMAPLARKKHLALTCDIALREELRLIGDAGRLRQILTNVLGNAIRFTERGEVAVTAKTTRESPVIRLWLEVRDTGIGIPHETQARLFEPFTQSDGTSTRRHSGLGLGLAISQELAHLMGGQVRFVSEPGRGSTFWIELDYPAVIQN